ncbi:fumarylacetoacetate hydrolase family protein [Candidatus Raskinella chloraquaticus]|uniref:Fumarylacetoacetate hydrolase n=1 Tax=Candidatus Raskinella chloraquaticus TaxID=1951219 RepID=A0A1W9HYV0_9HYPH|nr:MAG: fumarylacetoacetate hydrolase [Proteobacteria bacterium SG_bin8]
MTATLFDIPAITIPVEGRPEHFPVRRVYCVGRNYAAHAREFGNDDREPPFFFNKAADCLQYCPPGVTVDHPYPPLTANYHFEIEIVACLSKGGRNIAVEAALDHVFGYAVGLDMTRRDLQRQMGDAKKPWEIGKSADHSGPIGLIHPAARIGHPLKGFIRISVDGVIRQNSDLSAMTWNVAEQIAHLSRYYELFPGDIIFAGTPEGVGPVVAGNVMLGEVEGLSAISLKVV